MTAGPLVVIIEDEPPMRRFLRAALPGEGYRVLEAATGADGLSLVASHNPDVVLLDLGLPDGDGLTVLRTLREWTRVPVIVLSARGQELDKVTALDDGADDYLTKPFSVPELLARLRVALRHVAERGGPTSAVLEVQALRIDRARREVHVDGRAVHLTPTEFKLLVTLAEHAGRVLTHRQLLRDVWGSTHTGQSQVVRQVMTQLRHKIEVDPARPRWLLTELGVGYRLADH